VLVVAATARELTAPEGWATLVCGVGPVDAAARVAEAIALTRPAAILHVGIAGARVAAGLTPPQLVIGTEAVYCDLDVPAHFAPARVACDPQLLEAVRRCLPDAPCCSIGTSGRVGQTVGCDVEAMEGFAVLRAAQLARIPAIEVRAISNAIEEPDRARWKFTDAFAAICAATPRLVREIASCVS
jgi:nucleoside phosphorylase